MKRIVLIVVITVALYDAANASVLRLPTSSWIEQNYEKLLEAKGNHKVEFYRITKIGYSKFASFSKRRGIPAIPAADKRSTATGGSYQAEALNVAIKAFWPNSTQIDIGRL